MRATQIPTAAKLKELQRDLSVRQHFYPQFVENGELTEQEMRYRIEVIEAIIDDYKQKEKSERLP